MTDSVVLYPHHELMAEAEREREVFDGPESQALLDAVFDAVGAYSEFLERQDLIWGDGPDGPSGFPRMKAQALVVTVNYGCINTGQIEVVLKDGASDRVYGNGRNPCALGYGPPDIPHEPRDDAHGSKDLDDPKGIVAIAIPTYRRVDID